MRPYLMDFEVMAQKNEAHKVLSATRVYFACVAD